MSRRNALVLASLLVLLTPARSRALFHAAHIHEVMSGAGGNSNVQYVEIREAGGLQNNVANTRLTAFNCDGSAFQVLLVVPSGVPNDGADVRWIMASPDGATFLAASGISADFVWNNGTAGNIDPTCGMVCWGAPGISAGPPGTWNAALQNNYVDCLGYGGYTGPKKTSTHDGTPTSGTPTNQTPGGGTLSLTRSTFTGNNIADFAPACPTPENNAGSVGGFGPCTPPTTTTTVVVTTTVTTTTFPPLTTDHFKCYKIKPHKGSTKFVQIPNVSLVDQFRSTTVTVQKPKSLCTPVNKNGEDPTAASHPDHLKAYQIKAPKFTAQTNIKVVNQFGTIFVDAKKSEGLRVPTAKSLVSSPAAPVSPAVDHFECYKIALSKGQAKFTPVLGVTLGDQFGGTTMDVVKPLRLCNPANKNNEEPGAENHLDHLLCYQLKAPKGSLKYVPVTSIFVNNQFGPETLDTVKPEELCVPSRKNP